MLDNMTPDQIRASVAAIAGAAIIEVSGGVRFETLRDFAVLGIDVISIGALTHSAPSVDLSLTVPMPKPAKKPAAKKPATKKPAAKAKAKKRRAA